MNECDVAIVGAGAGGAAASWRLATRGVRVVCLERGDWIDRARIPTVRDDWEAVRLGEWHPNPNIRRLPADYAVDDSECPMRPLMFNGVGGSTVMWSCHAPRFQPSDFRVRSLDGVAEDWPLAYDDLAPYYALNERMAGIAGLAGDPAQPARPSLALPPARVSAGERALVGAFERLGWHWWPADLGLNTAATDGRGACNDCGPCELGCPSRAKSSADVTYWPKALAAGARIVTRATALDVPLDAQGRATGVVWSDPSGARHRLRARAVMIAANGVGTARLLLAAREGRGVANSSGLVGRNLMLHPLARVTGVFDRPMHGHRGIAAGAIISREFYETDRARGFVRGCKLQVLRSHGPAFVALGSTGRLPWGRAHHARFAATFDRTAGISICADDLPEPENRVALHPGRVDSDGLPVARMVYRVGANARAILDFGMARARELLAAAGAVETIDWPLVADAGFHLMGTARMGDDPARSVCDRWGRTHDVPNLWIADASLFVTGAAVNPTHTLQALALRAADALVGAA